MKIDYDTGMSSTQAEARLIKVSQAVQGSKLKFKVGKEYKHGGYAVTVETPYSIFSSWSDMQDYIRALVVDGNKTLHAEEDYIRAREAL